MEKKHSHLYALYEEFKNGVEVMDGHNMMDESMNGERGGIMMQSFRPVRREYSLENLLDEASERLYQANSRREKVVFSQDELKNAVQNRETMKQQLGLVFDESKKKAGSVGQVQGSVVGGGQIIEEEMV